MQSIAKEGKSYFFDEVDIQELFDLYAGTGQVERDRNNRPKNTEKIYLDHYIGIEESAGNKVSRMKIHHSKQRTHIVPMRKEQDHGPI